MMRGFVGAILLAASCVSAAEARELRVVTWNMGWHLSKQEAATWVQKCGAPFRLNEQAKVWEPADAGTPGWELDWSRTAPTPIKWDMSRWPPCNVYQANFKTVPVTEAAYGKRIEQIAAFVSAKVKPDIIAFQEVSGERAVREILPNGGADYHVCSFADHKVQRLAFAWRKELGPVAECSVENAISLPQLPEKDRVRPGLSLALNVDGQRLRLLTVHLKSSCVTPIEGNGDSGRGALAGGDSACSFLQRQIKPLEGWIEAKSADTDKFVVLGDFNRNLWHEQHAPSPVRTDGSDPAGPLPAGAKVRSLIGEVNDGVPPSSRLTLLKAMCPINDASKAACEKAENSASASEWKEATKTLSASGNLGCRNPAGLDHILVGHGLSAPNQAEKVALGKQGRTISANDTHPDPLLGLSDHCPLAATIRF